MNEQTANKEWTAKDEAEWQAFLDDEEAAYEQSVCDYYASRGQANLY